MKGFCCSFRISYNLCIFISSSAHFLAKKWNFDHFWAINWPSSANNSRNNWATELGSVSNKRSVCSFRISYNFLHFHKKLVGSIYSDRVKFWPFSGKTLAFFCWLHEKKWSYRAEIGLERKIFVCRFRILYGSPHFVLIDTGTF